VIIEEKPVDEPPDDPTDFSDDKVVTRLIKMMRALTLNPKP
jgi:hypothetical protein